MSKTLIKITTNAMVFLISISLNAQTTPEPPKTPQVSLSEHSDDDSNSYSYSVTSSDNDGQNKSTSVSISISNSDDSYTLRAKFPQEKHNEIKDVLTKEMSSKSHTFSKGKDSWNYNSNGEEVYEVSLNSKKITMYLDKEIASASLAEKFETLGLNIRTIIVGEDDNRREAERMQREADRLRRDAERMQREAERLQRDAKRRANDESRRFRDDAKRIADEAKRLADEASGLNMEASHKGGISALIKKLLNLNKTYLNEANETSNWDWINAQRLFINELVKDGLASNQDDNISFTNDETGKYINGHKLSGQHIKKYKNIFAKHGIEQSIDFSFYKINDHIVIVDSNANLEGFIKDAVNNSFLNSKKEKVKFQINGNSAYKNGNQLSSSQLASLNKLLLKNKIIPAPGKIFEIIKAGAFKVGYSVDGRTHLGTWSMTN